MLAAFPPDAEVVVKDSTGEYASAPFTVTEESWPYKWDPDKTEWVKSTDKVITIVLHDESVYGTVDQY